MADLDSIVINALYVSLHRNIFAASIAWIIFACNVGAGVNIVDCFLNFPIYAPVARLGLCMYLVHVIVQMMSIGTQRQPGYFSNASSFHNFFGDFVMTFTVSVVIFLSIEAPVLVIEKYFRALDKTKVVEQPNELESLK
jgi:hypothetical protein